MPIRLLQAQRLHNGRAGKERRRNSRAAAKHVEDSRTENLEVCPRERRTGASRGIEATVRGYVIAAWRGKAGRSQGVFAADTAKGCSHPPEVVVATGR